MNFMMLIQNFDISILEYIKNNMHSFFTDKAMITLSCLGNIGMIWIAIAMFLVISKKYRTTGFVLLGALMLGAILGEGILKHVIQRGRPCIDIPVSQLLIKKPLSYSFPSGHTTASFAAAGVLSRYFKSYSIAIFTLASLIAFSRLYLYVHYPTDVIAGVILGLICSQVSIYIFHKRSLKLKK